MELTPKMRERLDRLRFGDEAHRSYGVLWSDAPPGWRCALGQMFTRAELLNLSARMGSNTNQAVSELFREGWPHLVVLRLVSLNDDFTMPAYAGKRLPVHSWPEIADETERALKEVKDHD